MKIKAKFKGSNSLGYVNGENYWLLFQCSGGYLSICRMDNDTNLTTGGYCPYTSLKAFLNNWQVF